MRHTRATKYSDSKFSKKTVQTIDKHGHCTCQLVWEMRNQQHPDQYIAVALKVPRQAVKGIWEAWGERVGILTREAELAAQIKQDMGV